MSEKIPHVCPVCEFMLRDMNDVLSYEEFQCCTDCQDKFVYRNMQAWMSGSRPTKEEVSEFQSVLRGRASYLVAKL